MINKVLKVVGKVFLYICSILVLAAALQIILDKKETKTINIAKDFSKEIPNILESIYEEGFQNIVIDYNDPVLLQRDIFITTDLDQKVATTVMKKLKYLESLDPTASINIYIDTSGGYSGVMLANYIQTIKCPINTIALDFCCSAGAELLASGTGTRKAFRTSRIIPHMILGDDTSLDDEKYLYSSLLTKTNIEFWKKYSKMPKSYYNNKDEKFYNFSSDQALEFGIIDEIID